MTLSTSEKRSRAKAKKKLGPGKNGRPKKTPPVVTVEGVAEMQGTQAEMALCLGISLSTFQARLRDDKEFAEAIERGKARGKMNLRLLLKRHSEGEGGPAVNATIHRAKHELGQFDRPTETRSTVDINIAITSPSERIAAKLDDLRRRQIAAADLPQLEIIETVPERVESGMVEYAPGGGTDSVQGEPVDG